MAETSKWTGRTGKEWALGHNFNKVYLYFFILSLVERLSSDVGLGCALDMTKKE